MAAAPPFGFPDRARAWQRLLSGRRINLLDPSPLDFELEDIAFALSRVARWGGQTTGDHLYSVAQHSLMVLEIGEAGARRPLTVLEKRAFLLHDAEEGFMSFDPISPLKPWLGPAYQEIARRTKHAVHLRAGLPAVLDEALKKRIKAADRIAAATEAVSVAGYAPDEVRRVLKIPAEPLPGRVEAWPSTVANDRFLARLRQVMTER